MYPVTRLEQERIFEFAEQGSPATVLLPIEPSSYNSQLKRVMKGFMDSKSGDAIYVTFNKPAHSLAQLFGGMDYRNRLMFLDVISTHVGERADLDNAFFIAFPGDLTGLMVALSRALKMHNFRYLFLDSLSAMLIYNDERTSIRFLYSLAAMCKQNSMHLILISPLDLPDAFANSVSALAGARLPVAKIA